MVYQSRVLSAKPRRFAFVDDRGAVNAHTCPRVLGVHVAYLQLNDIDIDKSGYPAGECIGDRITVGYKLFIAREVNKTSVDWVSAH